MFRSIVLAAGLAAVAAGMLVAADVEWPSDFWAKVAAGRPVPAHRDSAAGALDSSVYGAGRAPIALFDSRFMDMVVSPGVNLNSRPPTGLSIIFR